MWAAPIFIPWCAGPSRHGRCENALKRLSTARANPSIRHSREGGNPRTNIPRKNVNRDTTTYVHTATPLRLSGESTPRTPIRCRNPEGCGRRQFSYLGVPAPAGMGDWYENALKRLSTARENPSIRHSREGGNPSTNIPRKNANRDTTTYLHTAAPTLGPPKTNATAGAIRETPQAGPGRTQTGPNFRLSGDRKPALYPDTGRESGGGGEAAPMRPKAFEPPGLDFITWCAGASRDERLL